MSIFAFADGDQNFFGAVDPVTGDVASRKGVGQVHLIVILYNLA